MDYSVYIDFSFCNRLFRLNRLLAFYVITFEVVSFGPLRPAPVKPPSRQAGPAARVRAALDWLDLAGAGADFAVTRAALAGLLR